MTSQSRQNVMIIMYMMKSIVFSRKLLRKNIMTKSMKHSDGELKEQQTSTSRTTNYMPETHLIRRWSNRHQHTERQREYMASLPSVQ